jgi:hypothetical protein
MGKPFWDSGLIHGDPELNEHINITEHLIQHISHSSELIFEGFNDSYDSNMAEDQINPWHFQYRVYSRIVDASGSIIAELDMLAPYNEKHFSNPNIRAINNCYQIVRKMVSLKWCQFPGSTVFIIDGGASLYNGCE